MSMRAPVADHAAPVLASHAPQGEVIVDAAGTEHAAVRGQRPRPAPAVPVEARLHRLGRVVVGHSGVPEARVHAGDLPDHAVADQFRRDAELGHAALHRAGLEDALVLARRLGEHDRLVNVVRERLLAVNVLPVRHRADAGDSVPVVRRRNAHGVDCRVLGDLAEIIDRLAVAVAVFLVHHRLGGVAARRVDVADGDDLDVAVTEKTSEQSPALLAHPDEAHHDFAVRLCLRAPAP